MLPGGRHHTHNYASPALLLAATAFLGGFVMPAAAQQEPVPIPTEQNPFLQSMAREIAPPQTPPELLSNAWMRYAMGLVQDPDVPAEGILAVLDLELACARLTPDRASPWRMVMFVADQLELTRPEEALAARRLALANLARLEPNNDSVTLARLTDAVESCSTAEERARAYEQLLDEAHAATLGAPVRARLAYQLAMLQNRMGNTELFARWLGEAVRIDPSFPQAALAAAGFFRTRVNDPVADVELLSIAIEANPCDLSTWSAMITVLLDGGAFQGAERVIRDAMLVAQGNFDWRALNNLTVDLAGALWGQGKRHEAQREVSNRLHVVTEDFRRMLQASDPSYTMEQLANMHPPLPTSLSLAALALTPRQSPTFQRLLSQALDFSPQDQEAIRTEGIEPFLPVLMEKSVLALLFKDDLTQVGSFAEECKRANLITPAVYNRLTGFVAWRQGRLDEAISLLGPLAPDDSLARWGYANALIAAGRTQEGARELLELARTSVGTTLGLMALDRLAEVLQQPVLLTSQLSPELAQHAQQLEAALQANLSPAVDDLVRHPIRALTAKVEALASAPGLTVGPYSYLGFKLSLTNHTDLPLAIGRNAPILSRLVMRTQVTLPKVPGTHPLAPMVIPFDRALQLPPRSTIEFLMDSATTPLGFRMANGPLQTRMVDTNFVLNPVDLSYGSVPGFLGQAPSVVPFAVAGLTVTPEWIAETLTMIAGPQTTESVVRLGLLALMASKPEESPEPIRPALQDPNIYPALAEAWSRLDPVAQAWVVTVTPIETPIMAPLLDAMRANTTPEVLTSWLLARITGADDPQLNVARRTGNPQLIRLADALAWVMDRRSKRLLEQHGVSDQGSSPAGAAAPPTGTTP